MADVRATRRWLVIDLLLLLVVLVLVAAVGWSWTGRDGDVQTGRSETSTRQLAVSEVAREVATAFLSVDHRDMPAVVERVLAGATGGFAEEYASDEQELIASVLRSRTVATSTARALGVADLEEDRAVVLVAADSVVSTRQARQGQGEPQVRKHRLRVQVVREGERWLVSELEFVR